MLVVRAGNRPMDEAFETGNQTVVLAPEWIGGAPRKQLRPLSCCALRLVINPIMGRRWPEPEPTLL